MLIRRQRGLTLLELMMGMVVMVLLLAMGVPSFTSWIRNTNNRTAAESILNGLQMARNEAVRRNALVRFTLTDSSGKVAWSVGCVQETKDCPATIQSRPAEEASEQARVGVSTVAIPLPTPANHFDAALAAGGGLASSEGTPAGVTFNGIGRVLPANVGNDFTRADITNVTSDKARRYVVLIGVGGQIRMCDPGRAFASDPQGCS